MLPHKNKKTKVTIFDNWWLPPNNASKSKLSLQWWNEIILSNILSVTITYKWNKIIYVRQ